MNPGPGAVEDWYTFPRGRRDEEGGEERVVWRARTPAAPIYAPVTEPSGAIKLAL